MSEAPAQTGESDSSGPTEPIEGLGIDSAYPPPPEKHDQTNVKGEDQQVVGGPSKNKGGGQTETNNETDSGAEQAKSDDRGVSVPPEYEKYLENDEEPPVNSPSVEAEKRDFESGVKDQKQTSNNDPPRIEMIPRYGQREEGSQNRDKKDVREGRVFGTEIEQSPIAPQAPPKQTEEQTAETPEQEATNLFLALRSGKKSFRNTPGGKGWKAEGKIVTKEEGKPFQVFKEVDGNDERRILISELRKIADARVGYQRPEPPTPSPSSTPVDALNAPPPDSETRQPVIDQTPASGRDEAAPSATTTKDEAPPTKPTTQHTPELLMAAQLNNRTPEEWAKIPILERARIDRERRAEITESQINSLMKKQQKPNTDTKDREESSAPPPPPENPKTTTAGGPEEDKPREDKISTLFGDLRPNYFILKEAGNKWNISKIVPSNLKPKDAEDAMRIIGANGLRAAIDKYPNLEPSFELENQDGIKSFFNEKDIKGMLRSTFVEAGKEREKLKSKEGEPKTAELGPNQIFALKKALEKYKPNDPSTWPILKKGSVKGAVMAARGQLGIEATRSQPRRLLDELKKAMDEGRIKGKEETKEPKTPSSTRDKIVSGLKESASRLAEKAGKVATGASSLTLTRQAEEGLRGAAEKSENKYQKFLYNAAAGFLNRFRWADKEQGTYAIGVVFGGGASLALGPAGNLVKIPILIGLNGIAVPGINFVRVRFINNALKPHIEDGAKREELSRQFDNAYRLWRPDSKEAFDNEIKRLSTEVAQGHNVPLEAQMLAQEEIQQKMESLSRFTKAQSHIRSFAAGLSAGSITASAGEAIFHGISSLIGGGGNSTVEGGAPSGGEASTNTPTPSGEQPTVTPTPVVEAETPNLETPPTTEIGSPPGGINQTTWENFNGEQRDAIQFIMDNPDRQDDFVKFIAATQESAASNEILGQAQEIIQNPNFVHSVEIAQGSTVSEMLASNGYDITWTTNDADIFGGHVLANYEELQQMHEQVKAAGIPLEFQDYPNPQEVVSLIKAAEGGDAAAFQQLVAASHWIPEGGSYNILTESGFEALKQKYGLS